jgi:Tfp pilus assembly protein PilF
MHIPEDTAERSPAQIAAEGFALHRQQRLIEAEAAFARGHAATPGDPRLLFGLAQTRYELGLPAAVLFAKTQRALPDNMDIIRNRAAAMAAEGDAAGAVALLETTLAARPDWLDGHKGLATLRWTAGDQTGFADSYRAACAVQPGNAALWMGWFAAVAQTRDWAGSSRILDEAETRLGNTTGLMAARLFVACESGNGDDAETLISQTAHIQGDTISLCRVRHFLRQRRLSEAQSILTSLVQAPTAPLFWPYQSLVWRLAGDERHHWLDRPDVFIRSLPVHLSLAEYAELADVLRSLHTLQKPYAEQSVRGGTQTDRSVILRHEPILQLTRTRWMESIRAYVADLPPPESGHPLLGTPREKLLIEGSWSVRLLAQGRNVPHTHARGWLSTAFYIALPAPAAMGPPPAGHIAFGTPPEELGLDLPAYRHLEPTVGVTAIFPSTTWHSTVPFADGERLALALDVRHPGA